MEESFAQPTELSYYDDDCYNNYDNGNNNTNSNHHNSNVNNYFSSQPSGQAYIQTSFQCGNVSAGKTHRGTVSEKWKEKRQNRNWMKVLPENENRRKASANRERENGQFKKAQVKWLPSTQFNNYTDQ